MVDLLQNEWVIGIGGGVVSGLFVALISRIFFVRRLKRENAERLMAANREVLYALRPGISDNIFPKHDVLNGLIKATAHKYILDTSQMDGIAEISDELLKEIMDTTFLSSQKKSEMCDSVMKFRKDYLSEGVDRLEITEEDLDKMSHKSKQESALATAASIILGIAVASLVMFLSTYLTTNGNVDQTQETIEIGTKWNIVSFFWLLLAGFTVILTISAVVNVEKLWKEIKRE